MPGNLTLDTLKAAVKRGDIDSTAKAYAQAFLEEQYLLFELLDALLQSFLLREFSV